ncbi:MAG: hypothetical protein KatS3mg103_0113 [Phycisphaerales bacterium]|nr:MAG: hypothetical protein KatS3mg103_0113 [Phycisphaerales bacterium]
MYEEKSRWTNACSSSRRASIARGLATGQAATAATPTSTAANTPASATLRPDHPHRLRSTSRPTTHASASSPAEAIHAPRVPVATTPATVTTAPIPPSSIHPRRRLRSPTSIAPRCRPSTAHRFVPPATGSFHPELRLGIRSHCGSHDTPARLSAWLTWPRLYHNDPTTTPTANGPTIDASGSRNGMFHTKRILSIRSSPATTSADHARETARTAVQPTNARNKGWPRPSTTARHTHGRRTSVISQSNAPPAST